MNSATFQRNTAETSGGAVYNAGTLAAANATFFENGANGDGGAVYNAGTLTVAGATFFGNQTTAGGGAVYSTGTLALVNSILVGNGGEDLYVSGRADGYYSFIGSMHGTFTESAANHLGVTPEEMFGGQPVISSTKIAGVTQRYFELKDGSLAAAAGTKLRVEGGILQYYDWTAAPRWANIGAIALTTAQLQRDQIGRGRLNHDSSANYSAGAISMLKELPSLTVTTDQDVVNPYDGVISLREALAYALAGTKAANDTYTITFADSLAYSTIEIDGKLGSLTVAAGAFTIWNPLTIDGGGKITIDGGRSNTRVCLLEIAAGNDVFLNGLTFEGGGNAKGIGGAIINAGDLSVTNTTFSGNGISGQRGGGAIYNTGNLVIDNAAFIGNQSSEGGGGAIYNTGSLVVNNATFSRNLADTNRGNSGGGAIWNSNGQVVVANSTFTGNQTHGKGGAIYAENGTLVVLNSTITQNSGRKDGSGIYCDSAELAIANSIVLGNIDSANIKVDGNNGFSAVYLVTSEAPWKTPDYSEHNFFDCRDNPFTSGDPQKRTVNGVEQLYFEVKDVSNVAITTDGTKLRPFYGKDGCDIEYYSKDAQQWQTLINHLKSVPPTGSQQWQTLINHLKSVPTDEQLSHDQIGRNRLIQDRWLNYSIGAVNVIEEDPSLTVTTGRDVVDPCDGLISLREAALYYAHSGDTVTFAGPIAAVLEHDLELPFDLNIDFADTGASVSGVKDGIALKSDFALTVQGAAAFNHLLFSGSGNLSFTGSTGGSATVDRAGGNVLYSSADSQVVYGGRYFDLMLIGTGGDGAEMKTFGGDITVTDQLTATGTANEQYLQLNGGNHVLTLAKVQDATFGFTDIHDLTAAEKLALDSTNTVAGTTNIAVYLDMRFNSGLSITYGDMPTDGGPFDPGAYARGILLSGDWLFIDPANRPRVKDSDVTAYEITLGGNYYAKATLTVKPKEITVGGIGAADKVYDGTTGATLDYGHVRLSGMVAGDALGVLTTGSFGDKNAGIGKTVTLGTLTLTGADAGNYLLAADGQQTATTASIAAREITVGGIGAADKVYDGTTVATLDYGHVHFSGMVAGDALGVTAVGNFGDRNAGTGKTVTLGTLTLTGADAGNYLLAGSGQQTATTASITPRTITVTADGLTKTEGAPDPALTYRITSGDLVAGDEFTGSPVRDAGELPGDYWIHQGSLTIDDGNGGGNYALTFVENVLTITAVGGELNFCQYTEGLNPNFNATVPAIEGSWLARNGQGAVSSVNPYAMRYPELLAMERYRQSRPASSDVALTFEEGRLMTPDHIDVFGDRLSGTERGLEFSIDGGDSDGIREIFSIRHEPGRLLNPSPAVPPDDLLPAELDFSAIRALPEKSRAFMSEFELLLDELVTV